MEHYFPSYFMQLSLFKELMKKKKVVGEQTNTTLAIEDNLFGTINLCINNVSYPFLQQDTTRERYEQVYADMLPILLEEERYHLLQESIRHTALNEATSYQSFVTKGHYYSEELEEELFFAAYMKDEYGETIKAIDDKISILAFVQGEEDEVLDTLYIGFGVEMCDDDYELDDWESDPKQRLRVLTNPMSNPNYPAIDAMVEFFEKEEAILFAKDQAEISPFYSDFKNNRVAFVIKSYEDFVHPGLLELGYLTYDDENANRSYAIENLAFSLEDYADSDYQIAGRSGGYLVLRLHEMTKEYIQEIIKVLKDALAESPKYYQSLEGVDVDDVLYWIEMKKQEEELDEELMEKLKKLEEEIKIA